MDKVKVGILGLRRGMSHLRNFLNTDEAEVIGAADRIVSCRDRAAESIEKMDRKVKFVAEFEELLELKGVGLALLGRLREECVLSSTTRLESVEAEFVDDELWFTEDDFEPSLFETAAGLPQVRDPVLSLVAYEAAVEQEIRRRMPLFVSGWVVAIALITGMLLLWFSGSVRIEGLLP